MFKHINFKLSFTNKIFLLLIIPIFFIAILSIQFFKVNYERTNNEYDALLKKLTYNYMSFKIYDNYYLRNTLVYYKLSSNPIYLRTAQSILTSDNFILQQYVGFSNNFYLSKAQSNKFKDNINLIKNSNEKNQQIVDNLLSNKTNISNAVETLSSEKEKLFVAQNNIKYSAKYDTDKSAASNQILTNLNWIIAIFNYNLLESLLFNQDVFNRVLPVLTSDRTSIHSFDNNIYNPNIQYLDFIKTKTSSRLVENNNIINYVNEFLDKSPYEDNIKQVFSSTYSPLFNYQNQVQYPSAINNIASASLENFSIPYILLFKHITDLVIKHSIYSLQNLIHNYIKNFNTTIDVAFFYFIVSLISILFSLFFGKNIGYIFRKLYDELKNANLNLIDYTNRLNLATNTISIKKIANETPYQLSSTRNKELLRLVNIFNSNLIRIRATLRDQILLKVTIKTVFSNLIYKNQSLINKQIKIIDQMERSESDNKKLQSLFAIDHLTARLRRNIDNLSILSGNLIKAEDKPIHLFDIARLSLGEIEEYNRVEIDTINSTFLISSKIIKSLSRIISELLDNALYFSSKNDKVTITFKEDVDYIIVLISDNGIGIKQEELDKYNERLSRVHDIDVEVIDHTGFYVVSKLANLNSLKVSLISGNPRGVTANILIPRFHIIRDNLYNKKENLNKKLENKQELHANQLNDNLKEINSHNLKREFQKNNFEDQKFIQEEIPTVQKKESKPTNTSKKSDLHFEPYSDDQFENLSSTSYFEDSDLKKESFISKDINDQLKRKEEVKYQDIPTEKPSPRVSRQADFDNTLGKVDVENKNFNYDNQNVLEKEDNTLIFNHLKDMIFETIKNENVKRFDDDIINQPHDTDSNNEENTEQINKNKYKEDAKTDKIDHDASKIKDKDDKKTEFNKPNEEKRKSPNHDFKDSGFGDFHLPTRDPKSNLNKELLVNEDENNNGEEELENTQLNPNSIKKNLFSIQEGIRKARRHVEEEKE